MSNGIIMVTGGERILLKRLFGILLAVLFLFPPLPGESAGSSTDMDEGEGRGNWWILLVIAVGVITGMVVYAVMRKGRSGEKEEVKSEEGS